MTVSDALAAALKASGIAEPNPVQKKALEAGLLGEENLVVAAPTASGKTLVAEIAALDAVRKGKKVVYIVPLRALASEKYREFREKYDSLGIRTAISIGDLDSSDSWLSEYDIIIVTSEKLDSLIRHGAGWINSVGLVIADEIHLLESPGRGPTLEVVLTRMMEDVKPRILGLSATISNHEEIAEWLGAKTVKSDYRPVKLYRGVCLDGKVFFHPEGEIDVGDPPLETMVEEAVRMSKQALVFISTRRGAEAAAEKLSLRLRDRFSPEERDKLSVMSERILNALDRPTPQCRKLAECVRHGAAFHHAGLTNRQREIIERGFIEGAIKVVSATPTLAAGINLPAWRVIVRDMKRFSSGIGMDYIPILEIQQMMGRAGRPKYDKEGQAILIARNENEARMLWDNYITGEPERVVSKLGVEPVLRMHVLALIASGACADRDSLFSFFGKTLYAHQYSDVEGLHAKIEKIVSLLEDYGFIERTGAHEGPFRKASSIGDEAYRPTRIGRRVSELYIDPMTANYLIGILKVGRERGITPFGLAHALCRTVEMSPPLSVRKGDMKTIDELLVSEEKTLLERPPNPWDIEYEGYVAALKTALLFMDWCDEAGEDAIMERFGVTPGELRTRLDNMDWMLYATQELSLLLGYMDILKDIRKLRVRVKHGVREELLPLVRLKGIGRARARMLFNSGFRSLDSLRKAPLESIERVVGPSAARKVKEQL